MIGRSGLLLELAAERLDARLAAEIAALRSGALDLHEGIGHPDPRKRGCLRWPEELRLVNEGTGELVAGRCRATNLCDYCARLFAVETAELLALDAVENVAPQVWMVLTTRTATTDVGLFRRAQRQVWRAIRRRWPDAEYAALVEFTTGYGPRSGGARRPHWNVLVKGVALGEQEELRQVVERVWCAHVDAEPWAQFVGPVSEVGGLMRYVTLHFLKESQQPPKGWRGHRFRSSRGYFGGQPLSELRPAARRSLQLKREVWKLVRSGASPEQADALARLELEHRDRTTWSLVHVRPGTDQPSTVEVMPVVDTAESPAPATARASVRGGAADGPVQPVDLSPQEEASCVRSGT